MHFHRKPYPMEDLTGPEEFFCQLADLEAQYQGPPHRRPVGKKALLATALAGLTGLSLLGAVAASTCTVCYAVSNEGDPPLAYVQGETAYTQAVSQVEEQVSEILHTEYAYPDQTRVELAIAPKESVQSAEELTASLMETVSQVREVWVLTVDGVAAGACSSREEVEAALELVREGYSNENTTSVTLCGDIRINLDYLPAEEALYDAETLAGALMVPTEEEEQPLLTVETVEEITYTQAVPVPAQEEKDPALLLNERKVIQVGVEGREERTDRVTRRCGVETGRETLAATVLAEPTPQVVAVGTGENVGAPAQPIFGDGVIVLPTGEVLTYTHTDQYVATAYTKTDEGCDDTTATGSQVHVGVVAVDPEVIRYGTRMFIVTNDGKYIYGVGTAEDCGTGIDGKRLDLYFDTDPECWTFGVRNCTVYFLGDANWR